jgi:hypothetical protein
VQSFTNDRSIQVFDVCIYGTALADPCNVDRLDVSFRRPEFSSLFYAVSGATNFSSTITSVKIKVNSTIGGGGVFWIVVNLFGQISVSKEP